MSRKRDREAVAEGTRESDRRVHSEYRNKKKEKVDAGEKTSYLKWPGAR